MVRRTIPQDVREQQIREIAEAGDYSFVGWVDGYKDAHSKVIMSCVEHGDWIAKVRKIVNDGSRCPGCGNLTPKSTRERQLRGIADEGGYTFVGWVNGYQNAHSKLIMNCSVHGDWVSCCNNIINKGTRCESCTRMTPQDIKERQTRELAEAKGYVFVGWDGKYGGGRSRAIINCDIHGDWSVNVMYFRYCDTGCPSCAITGYRPSIPGTLYALMSDCGSMVKIGISNVPDKRHAELRSDTPFNFTVYRQLYCEDGSQPPMLERMFHDEFASANQRGFDGATEWRQMSPDVATWLDLFNAK